MSRQWPPELDPEYQFVPPTTYLQIFGQASKYILPPEFWDVTTAPNALQPFIHRPNVYHVTNSFTGFTSDQMRARNPDADLIRQVAHYDRVLQRRKCKRRVRRARLGRLAQEVRLAILKLPGTSRVNTQGIRLFATTLKRVYIDGSAE